MEERFVLDNNDNVIDFEEKTDKYCLSQDDVCNLLNKQQQRIAELEQELAELKEMSNLIWIDLFHLNNDNNEWTKSLNKYKQEAQAKLKEIQGNE